VLGRRIARAQRGEKGWELPDLLVVDGGKGQLAIALAVLQSMGVTDLPVAALAKEKENALGHTVVDRVYMPGRKNAVEVREHMRSLGMLAHARDEAHRVSNALRTKLGAQRNFSSPLESIRGIGPKTRRALLKTLGSLEAISATDVDGLVAAGATRRQAEAVYGHFHGVQADFEAAEESAVDSAFEAEAPTD
jgi:excinuclease ABC subunit C